MAKPTHNVVDQAVARLGKTGASVYFFDRLNNHDWIEPLYERGFFKRPPGAIRNEEEGTIAFPDWPELRYLLRMAPKSPEIVGRIVVQIPETDNIRIQELLVQIGAKLPREQSALLADRALSWAEHPLNRSQLGEHFARFVAHLAHQGELKRSQELAMRLFSFSSAAHYIDAWYLERNLKHCLSALQASLGLEALVMLERLLIKAVESDNRNDAEDYSYIWRRDLGKENYSGKEPRDVLINALRETAMHFARAPEAGFDAVCEILLEGRRPLFKRMAMYIAAEVCDATHPFVTQTLFDPAVVDRLAYRAEYAKLLQSAFPHLKGETREGLIRFLTSDFLRSIPEERRESLPPDRAQALAAGVECERLLAFGPAIPQELVPRRDALVHEVGEPSPATAMWHGPTSPLADEQLQRMPIEEIVQYLRTWRPLGTFGAPSPEGLGRAIQRVARARAMEFSKVADVFAGSEPTYVRAVVTALAEAVAAKEKIEWTNVLGLLHWVCHQPVEPQRAESAFPEDADPGWSWTRHAIPRLIESGMTHRESGLGIEARYDVWVVLEFLLQDPDPADGDGLNVSESDYLQRSINSVRGLAVRAVVQYAWWIHTEIPLAKGVIETFDRDPEVQFALERSVQDPSPAVRCVLGEYFVSLFYLDREWTARQVDAIFPEKEDAICYWRATWSTYVEYSQPYDAAFDVLRPKYDLALRRLRRADDDERKNMGERGLGQHLASYFWRAVDGERATGRLLEYFDVCAAESVGHTLWFLGRGLEEAKDSPESTIKGLMDLWSHLRSRSMAWADQKRRELIRHFGTWFNSEQFDPSWALAELEEALKTGYGLIDLQAVLVRLGSLAEARPIEVARCTELLVKNEEQLRSPFIWERELASILKVLLASRDPNVRQRSQSIIDTLVEGGSLFARDLIAG